MLSADCAICRRFRPSLDSLQLYRIQLYEFLLPIIAILECTSFFRSPGSASYSCMAPHSKGQSQRTESAITVVSSVFCLCVLSSQLHTVTEFGQYIQGSGSGSGVRDQASFKLHSTFRVQTAPGL